MTTIPDDLHYILPHELFELIRFDPNSVFVLDNRTREMFENGHIPGAINIWLKDVCAPENLARLPRDKKIVIACWVGHTASQLVPLLRILGFDACGLKYGLGTPKNPSESKLGWQEQGLPIETGPGQ